MRTKYWFLPRTSSGFSQSKCRAYEPGTGAAWIKYLCMNRVLVHWCRLDQVFMLKFGNPGPGHKKIIVQGLQKKCYFSYFEKMTIS